MDIPYGYGAASLFGTFTTLSAFIMLFRQFYSQFVPEFVRSYIESKVKQWMNKPANPKNKFTLVVHEFDQGDYRREFNQLYQASQVYLSDKLRSKATRLKGARTRPDQPSVTYQLTQGEAYVETLDNKGIELLWNFRCTNEKGENVDNSGANNFVELTFDLAYKSEVLDGHIPSMLKYYDQIMERNKDIFLFTFEGHERWKQVKFDHPFTFDSLAIEPNLKKAIIDDLDMFTRRKEFYKKIGKAWKRGYLLYGPPGTGKSSLVAAIANYLRFNVYDLQLGGVTSDATLRKLMLATTNKSILVIEDIDCTIGLSRSPPPSTPKVAGDTSRTTALSKLATSTNYHGYANAGYGNPSYGITSYGYGRYANAGYATGSYGYGSYGSAGYGGYGYESYDDYAGNYAYGVNDDYTYGYDDNHVYGLYERPQIQDNQQSNVVNQQSNVKGDSKSGAAVNNSISLSGLLNFIDGLWSSCGDERIIIFTTNHKERLDPALLRPGRMDLHIHMSYLTMDGFRVFAKNYLGVSGAHPSFEEIEQLLKTANVTPAEVAEELIRTEDADLAFSRVVDMCKKKLGQ